MQQQFKDTMTINGTVTSITQITTPFQATQVTYTTTNGKEARAMFGSKFTTGEQALILQNLKAGDLIQVHLKKNEKGFFNATSLKTLTELPTKSTTPSSTHPNTAVKPYDATGQIKGNAVTNAVQLAIARKGPKTSQSDLQSAFDDVLSLHAYAEKIDILKVISGPVVAESDDDAPFTQDLL